MVPIEDSECRDCLNKHCCSATTKSLGIADVLHDLHGKCFVHLAANNMNTMVSLGAFTFVASVL